MSNPARKNALDAEGLQQLAAAIRDGDGVRCWLVRASGTGPFSSGYDVSALSEIGAGPLPDDALGDVFDLLASHPAPSVALLTGAAFGAGCELACACDFRVGDHRAAFCLPPSKLGVVYAPRGIQRIAAIVGQAKAKWMLLTGRKLSASEAEQCGLLDLLQPNDFEFYFLGRIEGKLGREFRATIREMDTLNVMKHFQSENMWVIGPHGHAD